MSDLNVKAPSFSRAPRFDRPMDFLDPAGNLHETQTDINERESEILRAQEEETVRIQEEQSESERASLEAKRKERARRAGRTGRRASIVSGQMGAPGEATVSRPTLG